MRSPGSNMEKSHPHHTDGSQDLTCTLRGDSACPVAVTMKGVEHGKEVQEHIQRLQEPLGFRIQSPTHRDQYDQLWRMRGVEIPRKPISSAEAHNLGLVSPWFKKQLSKLQFWWVS